MRFTNMSDKITSEGLYNYKCRERMTPGQIVDMFNGNVQEYEDGIRIHAWQTPSVTVDYLSQSYHPEKRSHLRVLDVAAGTGALGILLKSAGFVDLDALDPAEKMLEMAKSKDVYQKYFCEYMDGRRIPGINTGGIIVFAIPDSTIEIGYGREFYSLLSRLDEEGVLEKIVHLQLEDGKIGYRGAGPGKLYAYRVKVTEMEVQQTN